MEVLRDFSLLKVKRIMINVSESAVDICILLPQPSYLGPTVLATALVIMSHSDETTPATTVSE